jgi:hypothetical protein
VYERGHDLEKTAKRCWAIASNKVARYEEPSPLLQHVFELASEPVAVETVTPERTQSVRGRVRRFALLGGRAVEALPILGFLLLENGGICVGGLGMRTRTERAAQAFSTTCCGMMSPLHATSALGGAGLRGSASDLAVVIAKGDLLTYEVVGRTARDGVGDVGPCNTSVSVGGSLHEVGSMFDDPVKLEANRRRVECGLEGRVLSDLPILGLRGDVRDVDDLEEGG